MFALNTASVSCLGPFFNRAQSSVCFWEQCIVCTWKHA